MQQLTRNIFIRTGWPGANTGCVVTREGLVLIDTPHYPSNAFVWKSEIERLGTVKYLINTESHEDHFFCNLLFNAPVIAQERARRNMAETDTNQIIIPIASNDSKGLALIGNYRIVLPSITFTKELTLFLGKHSFHLIHLPGHSPSLIAVLIPEERVVFTGDNVCNQVQGFLHEADPYTWLNAIDVIAKMDVDYIVPGHGEACDKDILIEEKAFVQECMAKIDNAIRQGWTKEETVAKVSFKHFPLDKGLGEFGNVLLAKSVDHMYEVMYPKH